MSARPLAIAAPDRAVPAAMAVESTSAPTASLSMRGIGKRWRSDAPPVLDGFELLLARGTATWVGGRNGVGKTTMLRIAAGLIEPDRGRTEVWGLTAAEDRARYQRLVSFLPAGDRGLYARLTVTRQLEFWGRIAMVRPDRFRESIERILDAFDLRDLADRRVDRLSMGQRQRLRLGMTFLPTPDVVLLDEPLTSLDSEGAELLAEAVAEVLARRGSVLWCSPGGEHQDVSFDGRWLLVDGRLVTA